MAGSDGRSNGHSRINDSAATARQKALTEELGIDTYARYPRELIEFRMDRPPKDEAKRADWKPIHGPKARVYAAYMRYSWCWPICLPYAVVTDERDEILRDHRGRPLILLHQHVAAMLGLSEQRVDNIVLDLIADKLIRAESQRLGGAGHAQAVYIEAKPVLTSADLQAKSTLGLAGIEGPRLEPAVLRRFSNLLNQLGPDERAISVPAAALGNSHPQQMLVRDYRTLVWEEVLANRTRFLADLKSLRYSERNAYRAISTRARNLMGQTQSPDLLQSSSSSRSVESSASATTTKTPPVEANGTAEQPGRTPAAENSDLEFRSELQEKFRGAHKPVPTARQCTQTWKALQEAGLSPFGFLDFLAEPGKLKRIDHPGALPALVTEFGETAVIDFEDRRRREVRAAEIAKQSERDWEEIVAEHRSTLADPEASEEDKAFARKILSESN